MFFFSNRCSLSGRVDQDRNDAVSAATPSLLFYERCTELGDLSVVEAEEAWTIIGSDRFSILVLALTMLIYG